jgi:Xaa-Pro aminopeptidase
VGRRYSGPQRTLYDAVLAAQQAAIDTIRPGATLEGAHQAAVRVLVGALLAEHLLEGSADEIVEKGLYRRFYMHRTSHWLGHDVHDVGNYAVAGAPRPLEPGMVLTVEPGLYVPADADDLPAGVRGVGIRIEDDVLVTPSGHEVLSAAAPKQVSDIETLRGS